MTYGIGYGSVAVGDVSVSSLYIFMALFGVYALLMIFLLTRDSQTGANAYGPNPKRHRKCRCLQLNWSRSCRTYFI